MKITQLNLENFRSFVHTDIGLNAPRVFIAGVNGAGKSTIREGIKWALTGRCQGLDGKGAGADKLVPTANSQVHTVDVKLTLQDVIGVHRVWEPRGATLEIDGYMGTPTEQQAALYLELLKAEPGFVDAALDSTVFLNLHHADAKALVLQLLNVIVEVENKAYTLEQLDHAYDKAFRERKSAKDKLKGAFVPPMPSIADPTLEKKTLADKDAHLNGIGSLLASLRAEVGKYQQKIGGSVAQRDALMARQRQQNADYERVLKATEGVDLEAIQNEIVELEERLAIMEEDSHEAAPTPPAMVGSIDLARQRKLAKQIREFDPKGGCVLDGKIKCPVSKVTFFGRARDIEDALDKLSAPAPEPTEAPAPVKSPMVAQLSHLKAQMARQTEYRLALDNGSRLITETAAELSAIPDTAGLETELAGLNARITKGEGIRQAATAFYAQLDAHKAAQEHRAALEADVARLEALVDVLGPNGARVQALEVALGPFTRTVNETLKGFGWTVGFSVDPWQVQVNGRAVDTYSRSEQHRIGIALQIAIAQMSGLGFAVVDELDMLTGANREMMGRVIFGSTLDQVIVLSSREADVPLPDAMRIPGMIAIRLGNEAGQSVVLEQIGEGVAA